MKASSPPSKTMILTIREPNIENPAEPRLNTVTLEQTGKTSWLIGRDPQCDIVINPRLTSISRRHATLKVENGLYKIDIHSSNGITIIFWDDKDSDFKECLISSGSYEFNFNNENKSYTVKLGDAEANETVTMTLSSIETEAVVKHDGGRLDPANSQDILKRIMEFENDIHMKVLAKVQRLTQQQGSVLDADEKLKQDVRQNLKEILNAEFRTFADSLSWEQTERDLMLVKIEKELYDNIMRLGPITPLLDDKTVDEVMVNAYNMIFIERDGIIEQVENVQFYNDDQLASIIQRIVTKVGRHIDIASPMVDARLEDGSRVNAVIPPVALDGPSLTIRKFKEKKLTTEDLIEYGTMNQEMAAFLESAVISRQNILISGGTGSGKTTLLNVLGEFIPLNERLVIIEDSAELRLTHVNKVRMEARPANTQGAGEVTIRNLLVNSLRMRPDRIIIGECRSGEALDMLQAMNTGHDGSLTTVHANSPRDALSRLENMVLMAGFELPVSAIREQIASAIKLVIQQNRLSDGSRKIVEIAEITGKQGDTISMQPLFKFKQTGMDADGRIIGEFDNSGMVAKFMRTRASEQEARTSSGPEVKELPPKSGSQTTAQN